MTAINFNAADRKQQAREQLKAALTAYRLMLDTFVSNQMQQSVTEAQRVRPHRRASSQPTKAQ